jgi:hypothetical protein
MLPVVAARATRAARRRQLLQNIGTLLAYLYVLRVPLVTCGLVVALPLIAVPRDAAAGSLLRGLFDIVSSDPGLGWFASFFPFALLTFAGLMVAATIAITSRLILLDGHERFDIQPLPPKSPGIQLVVRLIPVVSAAVLIAGAWIQSWPGFVEKARVFAAIAGTAASVGVFWVLMTKVHDRVWDAIFTRKHGIASPAGFIFVPLRFIVQLTPKGFVNAKGCIRARHAFAMLQFLLSLIFYVALFALKSDLTKGFGDIPQIPTLCLVLILAMLVCWGLAGVTFLFDRFRVPLITVLVAYGTLTSVFTWNDHFFQTVNHQPGAASLTAGQVLRQRSGNPAIVIAAEGGGIQAAAWTARVVSELQRDSVRCGDSFDDAFVAISSVSGGSVGAMYVVDAYQSGHLLRPALDAAVKSAEASSLDDVAWGLTYPDLVWSVFPFLKGVYRPFLVKDRGSALEDAWKRTPGLPGATLDKWRLDLKDRVRPAVMFNATVAETGQRMLLSTTTLETQRDDPGRREFSVDFPDVDVPVTTAARLSATFPYVSPAARVNRHGGFDDQYHYVDGGYYDNYGTATLIEWLDKGLSGLGRAMPSRVLVIEIRSFPDDDPTPPGSARGWVPDAVQPLKTLYAVRGTGQDAHSNLNVHLLKDDYGGELIQSVKITFPESLADDRDDPSPPLSWHLTLDDRGRLARAWHGDPKILEARKAVHMFMRPDNGTCIDP